MNAIRSERKKRERLKTRWLHMSIVSKSGMGMGDEVQIIIARKRVIG
jgi:hypothetical protein